MSFHLNEMNMLVDPPAVLLYYTQYNFQASDFQSVTEEKNLLLANKNIRYTVISRKLWNRKSTFIFYLHL